MVEIRRIFRDVERYGDEALRKYTRRFDGAELKELKVSRDEMRNAEKEVSGDLKRLIRKAAGMIEEFHRMQLPKSWVIRRNGMIVGQKPVPLDTVGVYIPRGYFSTALMTIIPARVAGVRRIVACTPPRRNGNVDPKVLYAAQVAGCREIYKVGGAQAIAAMCVGTKTIPRVDKIVGPGNLYVMSAKMFARNFVEIDFPAGPSEIAIIADESADPEFLCADLEAQLEHGKDSIALLVTTSRSLAAKVSRRVKGAMICRVKSMDEGIELINRFAPEHLEIMTRYPMRVFNKIRNAASVFIGGYSTVALGDYLTSNHVLPTSGYAKVFSALGVNDFVKFITFQRACKRAIRKIGDDVRKLAAEEGMEKHARSIEVRMR